MKWRTVCLLLFLTVPGGFAGAQIPATDHSYTTSSQPTSNYGDTAECNCDTRDRCAPSKLLSPSSQFRRVGFPDCVRTCCQVSDNSGIVH